MSNKNYTLGPTTNAYCGPSCTCDTCCPPPNPLEEINNLTEHIRNVVPGIIGDIGATQGPQGEQGPAGADGAPGVGVDDIRVEAGQIIFIREDDVELPPVPLPAAVEGPEGPEGPQGIQGLQGLPGTPGADGADGADGLPGADGAQGIQGLPGADGAPGADAPIPLIIDSPTATITGDGLAGTEYQVNVVGGGDTVSVDPAADTITINGVVTPVCDLIDSCLTGLAHTAITNIDLQPTATPNEYTVVIEWTGADGVAQSTTDPTPITIATAPQEVHTGAGVPTLDPGVDAAIYYDMTDPLNPVKYVWDDTAGAWVEIASGPSCCVQSKQCDPANALAEVIILRAFNPDGSLADPVYRNPDLTLWVGDPLTLVDCPAAAETPLAITTDGTALGVTQGGTANHTADITVVSPTTGNAVTTDPLTGGAYLDETLLGGNTYVDPAGAPVPNGDAIVTADDISRCSDGAIVDIPLSSFVTDAEVTQPYNDPIIAAAYQGTPEDCGTPVVCTPVGLKGAPEHDVQIESKNALLPVVSPGASSVIGNNTQTVISSVDLGDCTQPFTCRSASLQVIYEMDGAHFVIPAGTTGVAEFLITNTPLLSGPVGRMQGVSGWNRSFDSGYLGGLPMTVNAGGGTITLVTGSVAPGATVDLGEFVMRWNYAGFQEDTATPAEWVASILTGVRVRCIWMTQSA